MNYFDQYCGHLMAALGTVDVEAIEKATKLIERQMGDGKPILTFGNGGSAAIADHAAADFMKLVGTKCRSLRPWVVSLVSNTPMLTAISNDYAYGYVFSDQIEYCPSMALVLGVSSSGNSLNVVKGFNKAKEIGFKSIALVGFEGGEVLKQNLADVIIHVNWNDYGICEDVHQIILHGISQDIIKRNEEIKQ